MQTMEQTQQHEWEQLYTENNKQLYCKHCGIQKCLSWHGYFVYFQFVGKAELNEPACITRHQDKEAGHHETTY